MDFRADDFLKKVINDLCDKDYKPTIPDWKYWKFLTERMLRWKSLQDILNMVLDIAAGMNDEEWIKGYPYEIFQEKNNLKKVGLQYKNLRGLNIIKIAENYGLKVKKNRTICPFHKDTDPSLVFYPKTNTFHCFGCRLTGDVIYFIKRMEGLYDIYKERTKKS